VDRIVTCDVKRGARVRAPYETTQPNYGSAEQDSDPGARERKFTGTSSEDFIEEAVFKSPDA